MSNTFVEVSEEPILQQLRAELAEGLGLERGPAVHYDPADGRVEVVSSDRRVPGIVAGHAPDRRRGLSPNRRELLELIEEHEGGGGLEATKRDRLDTLLFAFVKEQLGGQG
jgi:hypothetical protein